jgi:hypothetical protein
MVKLNILIRRPLILQAFSLHLGPLSFLLHRLLVLSVEFRGSSSFHRSQEGLNFFWLIPHFLEACKGG